MGWYEPQATYSTKFTQKDKFDKTSGYELTLKLIGKFEYLPRLRRSPNCDTFRSLFLCLNPKKGIEDGTYSDINFFKLSDGKDYWSNLVTFDGGGSKEINKVQFITASGKISTQLSKDMDTGIIINPKDPVVEIIFTANNAPEDKNEHNRIKLKKSVHNILKAIWKIDPDMFTKRKSVADAIAHNDEILSNRGQIIQLYCNIPDEYQDDNIKSCEIVIKYIKIRKLLIKLPSDLVVQNTNEYYS